MAPGTFVRSLKELQNGEQEKFGEFENRKLIVANVSQSRNVSFHTYQNLKKEGHSKDEITKIMQKTTQPQVEKLLAAGKGKVQNLEAEWRKEIEIKNGEIREFAKTLLNHDQWFHLRRMIIQSSIRHGSTEGQWGFYQVGVDLTARPEWTAYKAVYLNEEIDAIGKDVVQDACRDYLVKHLGKPKVDKLAGKLIRFEGPFSSKPATRSSPVFAKYTKSPSLPVNVRRTPSRIGTKAGVE